MPGREREHPAAAFAGCSPSVTAIVRIGLAISVLFALALAIAAAVTIAGLHFLHSRQFKPEPQLSAATVYDLLKIGFAVAAGIGGVITYRRQRIAELAVPCRRSYAYLRRAPLALRQPVVGARRLS